MFGTKEWYASTSIWGGIVTVFCALLGLFGYHILPADQASAITDFAGIAGFVGGLLAIYGRVTATQRIAAGPPPTATAPLTP